MRKAGWFLIGLLAVLAAPAPLAVAVAADEVAPVPSLAHMDTPRGTPLDDILSGRAQPGFVPVLSPGFAFTTRPDRALWVRIRADLPPGQQWRLEIPRIPLERLRLRLPDGTVVAEDSFFARGLHEDAPWPAHFDLPLPEGLAGPVELYLETEGHVMAGLHVALRTEARSARAEADARRGFRWIYGLLLAVAMLSLVRHVGDPESRALPVGAAALGSWLACLAANGHLYSLPEIALLSYQGASVPPAMFLLGAGPLVLAMRHYAGLAKSAPDWAPRATLLGWLLVLVAVLGLSGLAGTNVIVQQWVAWLGYGLAVMACLAMLAIDPRSYRWGPILGLLALCAGVGLRVAADQQAIPVSWWALYGWQLALAATLALMLLLPWGRALLQRRAARRRATPPEPSLEEKIAVARERLMESLDSGLKNAADEDLAWIAYRRLLEGLKPVLVQESAAVVGMQADGEDLLQVEPRSAEPRYRELMSQRTTLLRNLSKLKAPQQLGMDFDGPEGPLEKVQLAVIPLPVRKPGWGALLVERAADVMYSEAELALCAEFAAMASMAGEEAVGAVGAQRAADSDPVTGALREPVLRQVLQQRVDGARQAQQPLCVLHLVLDQVPALRDAGGEVGVAAGLRPLADLLRDEAAHGDVLGVCGNDGFLLVSQNKKLLEARDYADRLRAAVQRMAVDPRVAPFLTVSVGVAQAGPGERDGAALAERATRSARIANKNGGNQIFS